MDLFRADGSGADNAAPSRRTAGVLRHGLPGGSHRVRDSSIHHCHQQDYFNTAGQPHWTRDGIDRASGLLHLGPTNPHKQGDIMRILDFHNHFYPPEYLDAIRNGPSNVKVTVDAEGNPLLHYPGDYNVAVPGHRDIDYRSAVLERTGVEMQLITLTTPGTHIEDGARAQEMSRI